ncbi:MAG: FAD-dependent oxidoreductase [Solirubrobacteraceae bacterium]|nr:FAD-dependent oxidoreductase [Solirubrobacteraceae bacterium]
MRDTPMAATDLPAGTLPPGFAEPDPASALAAFAAIVGDEHVVADPAALERYREPHAPPAAPGAVPAAVVRPASAGEVRGIVRAAREFGVPLAVPGEAVPGRVVLDLSRMNRVLEVDTTLACAVVEPGATYRDVHDEIERRGLALWLDVPDGEWDVPIGAGPSPRTVGGPAELVLDGGGLVAPDGDRAIVTKTVVPLLHEPPAREPYLVTLPCEEDLGAFVDVVRGLRRTMVFPTAPTLRHVLLDAPAGTDPAAGPDALQLGHWNFFGAVHGDARTVELLLPLVEEAFAAVPGARLFRVADRPADPADALRVRAAALAGRPPQDPAGLRDRLGPGGARIAVCTVAPATAETATALDALARERCAAAGFAYLAAFTVGPRELRQACSIVYDGTSPEAEARALALCRALVRDSRAAGARASRARRVPGD